MKNRAAWIIFCLIFSMALSLVTSVAAQNGWTNAAPMTTPRYGAATGVIDGKVYVAGGHTTAYVNILEVYDPATNTWTTLAPMPAVRYTAFAAVIGGKLYLAGGYDGSSTVATLFVYDPPTNVWSTLAQMPTARALLTGGVINGKLHVAGGYTSSITFASVDKLEVYDPATNTWATNAPMPNGGRYGAGSAVFFDKLYVAGGYGNAVSYTKTLEVYDPSTDSWTAKASMPQIQYVHAAGVIDGQFYNAGGLDGIINVSKVQIYDPATDTWSNAPVLPTLRRALSAEVVGNSIYVVGGYNGTIAVGTNEAFTPPPCSQPPANLVGWWAGDGDARDNTGVNNGTLVSSSGNTLFAVGYTGQSLRVTGPSGGDESILVPDNDSLEMTSQFTLAAWIRPISVDGFRGIISRDGIPINRSYVVALSPNGGLIVVISDNSTNASGLTAPDNSITPGVWQHVAATFNAGSLKLYVNGIEVASTTSSITSIYANGSAPLKIGSPIFGTGQGFQGGIDEAMVFNRALSAAEINGIFAPGKKGVCKSGETDAGTNVQTLVGDQTVTFQNAVSAGTTTSNNIPAAGQGELPPGFTHTGLAYDIATTAAFTGNVTVCFNIRSVNDPTAFTRLKVLHREGGLLVNRTVLSSFSTRRACGRVSSLSPFVIANGLAPSAANASLSGRVTWGKDQGAPRVRVTVSGGDLPQPITVTTNAFGYYRFDDLPAGRTYIVEVASKNLFFPDPARIVDLAGDAADIDFHADSP